VVAIVVLHLHQPNCLAFVSSKSPQHMHEVSDACRMLPCKQFQASIWTSTHSRHDCQRTPPGQSATILQSTVQADAVLQVYSGGLDNNITVWDLRKGEQSMSLTGHTDSITGLSLNPDGTHLLSNAVDNSLRVWDMRPYAPANRCEKIFTGHQHNYERNLLRCSWSSDGSKVRCHFCARLAIPCTIHSDNNICKGAHFTPADMQRLCKLVAT